MTMSTTRRTLLAGAAAAAATPLVARAQGGQDLKGTTVVFASWGGAYQEADNWDGQVHLLRPRNSTAFTSDHKPD
jgi:hypothetical protein